MFRPSTRENICRYCTKQLHNNRWSVVYVDLLAIIRVVVCYTGSYNVKYK
jgi:hypothetical protein